MSEIVSVLMSTYNGQNYLKDQINSVLVQQGVGVNLLIRDDGSTDNTQKILEDFSNVDDRVHYYTGPNIGVIKSFFDLMNNAPAADYYAFCDQDDIWLEDKLKSAINILSKSKTANKPALYMGAYQMVDTNLKKIYTPIKNQNLTLPTALVNSCATGCTMVFNRELLTASICNSNIDLLMHDYWLYLVCLVRKGFVYYDTTPHILYRQHNHNVIGGIEDSFYKKWYVRLKKLFLPGDNYKSKLAKKLLEEQWPYLCNEDKLFLKRACSCQKIGSKINLLKTKGVLSNSWDTNLQTIGLILTGKF